jgi:hypothetical protein
LNVYLNCYAKKKSFLKLLAHWLIELMAIKFNMIFFVLGDINTAKKPIKFLHEFKLPEYTYRRRIPGKPRQKLTHHCVHRIYPLTHCTSGLVTQTTVQLPGKFKFFKVIHMRHKSKYQMQKLH